MRTDAIHPASCPCRACHPLLPPERARQRARQRVAALAIVAVAILALTLI